MSISFMLLKHMINTSSFAQSEIIFNSLIDFFYVKQPIPALDLVINWSKHIHRYIMVNRNRIKR